MINLIIGIALGAAFSKFWLMLWDLLKASPIGTYVLSFFKKAEGTQTDAANSADKK